VFEPALLGRRIAASASPVSTTGPSNPKPGELTEISAAITTLRRRHGGLRVVALQVAAARLDVA
jgi:hypothetical protein